MFVHTESARVNVCVRVGVVIALSRASCAAAQHRFYSRDTHIIT